MIVRLDAVTTSTIPALRSDKVTFSIAAWRFFSQGILFLTPRSVPQPKAIPAMELSPVSQRVRAVDLYSGVGGWSLGLHLAGVAVVASYEKSTAANETNRINNGHETCTADIREMDLGELPKDIGIVVGSPPCTQFSFSNRGGNGDLADGLRDVVRFLTIVDHLRPAAWAMENVPRLAQILDVELQDGGCLAQFRHLQIKHRTFDMSDFGVPQRRRRCIVGNFDFDLLQAYAASCRRRTLRDVVEAFASSPVQDPIFGHQIESDQLFDHDLEEPLDLEEVRINHAAKALHPIYNSMPFPDPMDRAVRTVTATCTRVSRESIVIETSEGANNFRRLSIRERASAQGFPATFQFYGASHGQKLKMVGNAIPPLFAYYIAHAIRETPVDLVPNPSALGCKLGRPTAPPQTQPHKRGFRYRADRSFKFSIANLRLKSGVRFELNNGACPGATDWQVLLVFGTSKAIRHLVPDPGLEILAAKLMPTSILPEITAIILEAKGALAKVDVAHLQAVWSHTGPGATRPFMLLDLLNEFAENLINAMEVERSKIGEILDHILQKVLGADTSSGTAKLLQYAPVILAGLIVGGCANAVFKKHQNPIGTTRVNSKRRTAI